MGLVSEEAGAKQRRRAEHLMRKLFLSDGDHPIVDTRRVENEPTREPDVEIDVH